MSSEPQASEVGASTKKNSTHNDTAQPVFNLESHPRLSALCLQTPAAASSSSAAAATAVPVVPAKADLSSLPIRAYLDQTVVPLLLQGMSQLAKDR